MHPEFLCTLRFKDLEGLLAARLPRDVGPHHHQAEQPPEPVEVRVGVLEAGAADERLQFFYLHRAEVHGFQL